MARNRFDVDETLESPFRLGHLKRSFQYIAKYKWLMIFALLFSAVGSVASLYGPILIEEALDVAVPNKDMNALIRLSLFLIATVLISVICKSIQGFLTARAGQGVVHDIRRDLFAHLQKLPFSYYDNRPHGKILVRVVQYVNSVSDMLSNGLLTFIIEMINIIFIIIFMFQVSVPLASIVVAGLPLLIAFLLFIKPRQRRAWQAVSNKNANINAFTQESIDGVQVTQAFNRQKVNEGIYERLAEACRSVWMKMEYLFHTVWFSVDIISKIVFVMMYIAGVYWIHPMVSFGVLMAMGTYVTRFWQPITTLGNTYNQFINGVAYLERIFETMDEPVVVEDREGAVPLPPVDGVVEFKNIGFEYEQGTSVLQDVSFTVLPGESIALVGPTGAGKTTIVNLLSRFYNIDKGQVLIDGHNIMDVTLHSLRSQMGIMLQDSFIFSGTILENIRLGRLDATDQEVIAAAKAVNAHEFIEQLPNGYNTEVEERGGGLSQGQKQLLAFARTLLVNPKLLILDEATSAIDTATERLVQQNIKMMLKGRTSFIVAHRLSTIRDCNKIMYIDGGRIAESGTHNELMALRGKYYHLYTTQLVTE